MTATPLTLNLIGPGRAGRTLAALLVRAGGCLLQDVLGAGFANTGAATAFIGAGRAVRGLPEMRPADLWLLTPPDAAIEPLAKALAAEGFIRPGDVVFHCSGSLPSSLLAPLAQAGAQVASVHPLKSFADPAAALRAFAGTWCTVEGDAEAIARLRPLFEDLGARIAVLDPAGKTLYHAASVLVCNDLVALMEAGLQLYEKAGLERATAQGMMEPLVRETLGNVFALGTVQALTGPVARGDAGVVQRQLDALQALDPRIAAAYRALNAIALELARRQGGGQPAALDAVGRVLEQHDPQKR